MEKSHVKTFQGYVFYLQAMCTQILLLLVCPTQVLWGAIISLAETEYFVPTIFPQIPATLQTLQLLEEEQMPGINIVYG